MVNLVARFTREPRTVVVILDGNVTVIRSRVRVVLVPPLVVVRVTEAVVDNIFVNPTFGLDVTLRPISVCEVVFVV
jgi:hypothetical protein